MSTPVAPNEEGFDVVVDSHALVRYLVTNLIFHPIPVAIMALFGAVSLEDLRDPFDRFILATAAQLRVSLVTADQAISKTGMAEVIW